MTIQRDTADRITSRCQGFVTSSRPHETASFRGLPRERRANLRKMMIAVPNRVILERELSRKRRIRVQGERSCCIELVIGQGADRRGSGCAVGTEELECICLAHALVLLCMLGIDVRNDVPRYAG